jgi:hypothetical protein
VSESLIMTLLGALIAAIAPTIMALAAYRAARLAHEKTVTIDKKIDTNTERLDGRLTALLDLARKEAFLSGTAIGRADAEKEAAVRIEAKAKGIEAANIEAKANGGPK